MIISNVKSQVDNFRYLYHLAVKIILSFFFHYCFFFAYFRSLVDKGAGHVMKFSVRIQQRSLVVLGRAFNLKMLRKTCSVASIVEDPSAAPNENKTNICSSPGNKMKVKSVSLSLSVIFRITSFKYSYSSGLCVCMEREKVYCLTR